MLQQLFKKLDISNKIRKFKKETKPNEVEIELTINGRKYLAKLK
jgi:hypothetical protein